MAPSAPARQLHLPSDMDAVGSRAPQRSFMLPETGSGSNGTTARLDFDPDVRPALALPAATESPLLLLIDDDQHGREGWAEFFHEAGYRISQASDGQEALAKVSDRRPDLILVDLGIPRLDGWELTRRVKGNPDWRQIPIIVLSGLDYPDALERVTAAGCDAFVSKPCEPLRLLAVVRGLLARRGPSA
jgi:CheY-like chemotaxis protein